MCLFELVVVLVIVVGGAMLIPLIVVGFWSSEFLMTSTIDQVSFILLVFEAR